MTQPRDPGEAGDSGIREFEILTPSYARDFDLCRDLVRSTRRFAPPGTRHTIVVPANDIAQFAQLEAPEVRIVSAASFLPRSFVHLPGLNVWVNTRWPWIPVRGWIAQQIVKLSAVAASSARAVLVVDSDLEFVRPFSVDTFTRAGGVPLYRLPDAVTGHLPRHMVWDEVARRLVGLPGDSAKSHPDYICWPCLWEPRLVRELLARVEDVGRRSWTTLVGRELHFSEMVLYGVFVEALVANEAAIATEDMHCRSFSDEIALDGEALQRFLATITASDVAVMISAKSGTDLELRRQAIASIRAA